MDFVVIIVAAFFASLLTFFSGFGLGTLLSAVFFLFFDLQLAIAITAVVHLLNNIFKLFLVGKNASREVVIKFGIPALFATIIGAFTLKFVSDFNSLYTYYIKSYECKITIVKLITAIILIIMVALDWSKKWKSAHFDASRIYWGGALTGFFGGLSGHQGAFRSMFLINQNLSKVQFIGSGVAIASIIDLGRLPVYISSIGGQSIKENWVLITVATISAFAGAYLGSKLIEKVTIEWIQNVVAILVISIAIFLGFGII